MLEHESNSEKVKKSHTKIAFTIGVIALALSFILLTLISLLVYSVILQHIGDGSYNYLTSPYSKFCYGSGDINPNMKSVQYFQTLKDCGKPLYGNE